VPIQPIGEEKRKGTLGSPYSIRDLRAVSAEYGTPEDLRRLVREAHDRGLRVILDFVANHTAWDNVLMDPDRVVPAAGRGRGDPGGAEPLQPAVARERGRPRGGAVRGGHPAIGLPVQPGGVVPEREKRTVELPKLVLDAWGVPLFRRGPSPSSSSPPLL